MNDRNRRHHPTRRHGHQQNHSRSTSHNHGQSAHSSSGQYRHPSTTISLNDDQPGMGQSSSSSSRSHETSGVRCEASICYSYLVAIFSSFLVVLGIYLSMTRFNIRFLYLSLVGLLFEAIGACVYCLSNIKTNASVRRKTTINSNDFNHLNANTSGGNNPLYVPPHNAAITQPDGQQRGQLAISHGAGGTITHILSNGTLTGRTGVDNADASNQNVTDENNSSTAIVIDNASIRENQSRPQNEETIRGTPESRDIVSNSSVPYDRGANDENYITVLANVKNNPTSAQLNELPKNHPIRESIGETSDFSSATSLLGNHRGEEEQSEAQHENQPAADNEAVLTQVKVSQISDSASGSPSPSVGSGGNTGDHQSINCENIEPNAPQRTDHFEPLAGPSSPSQHQTEPLQNSDLNQGLGAKKSTGQGGLVPSDATDSAALGKSAARQRQANLRRTLVMGLGGVEEMIEIDEDDLDNMSIMPPPYESIADESKTRQYTDI